MDFGLKDRVAVVTGGSSGIGFATVEMLLGEGARVAFCGRDSERLESAAAGLAGRHQGERILASVCDVLDKDQVEAFRVEVAARFGAADILVNNAGQGRFSTFETTTDEDWREELELKFFSLIHPTRAFLPLLEASDIASIVCVNALLAKQPEACLLATSAARSGVQSLAKGLSLELAPKGIRVNTVLLGLIYSGQWRRRFAAQTEEQSEEAWLDALAKDRRVPLGRVGQPEEVAAAILFLASPRASFVTGTAIDVSGGQAHYV